MKNNKVEKFSPLVQWLGSYGLFGAALLSLIPVLAFSVSAWYFIVPLLRQLGNRYFGIEFSRDRDHVTMSDDFQ